MLSIIKLRRRTSIFTIQSIHPVGLPGIPQHQTLLRKVKIIQWVPRSPYFKLILSLHMKIMKNLSNKLISY